MTTSPTAARATGAAALWRNLRVQFKILTGIAVVLVIFGVVFKPNFSLDAVDAMAEALQLFGMGASWGGYESLALPSGALPRTAGSATFGGQLLRLHIGLEAPADLIADLEQALGVLRARA